MNEIKRYDQALADQLEHVPMPPEDMAWAEMKKMLEEDDDDPVVIPFFRRTGCLLAGLVAALLLIIGGWLYFKRDAAPAVPVSKQVPVEENSTGNNAPAGSIDSNSGPDKNTVTLPDTPAGKLPSQGQTASIGSPTVTGTGSNSDSSGGQSNNKKANTAGRSAISITKGSYTDGTGTDENKTKKRPGYASKNGSRTKAGIAAPTAGLEENTTGTAGENKRSESSYKDPGKMTAAIQPGATAAEDSVTKKAPDSSATVKKDSVPAKKATPVNQPGKEKEEQQKQKYWQLAAGLAVYQPIPIAGEPAVPYNRYGRKGSLTDYVPSAYLRLYRSRKWFVHAEFRYGAPQAVKPFDYKQQVRDSFQTLIRTVYQLRKTYYHQVPLSFNYFVLPNLSVGAGVVYNRFTGAVAQQNVYRTSAAAQDTLTSSSIVSDAGDDRFVKNHFQWSVEAQYQWKRLSIGARYSSDLTPYIKFDALNNTGATIEKKMSALNVFIRYDLWRSKKWGK